MVDHECFSGYNSIMKSGAVDPIVTECRFYATQ